MSCWRREKYHDLPKCCAWKYYFWTYFFTFKPDVDYSSDNLKSLNHEGVLSLHKGCNSGNVSSWRRYSCVKKERSCTFCFQKTAESLLKFWQYYSNLFLMNREQEKFSLQTTKWSIQCLYLHSDGGITMCFFKSFPKNDGAIYFRKTL